ncbi:hypothetical protein CDAR_621051 [Caerostris darwini]|uniref:Uncharacterized protein n=1 Tax=Caerostris darwini TaxID=1538125 RepID=A0AAV4T811_9ARAC|nr:hypothetical protein CDAR_621051 [Caerostris darwini]
MIEWQSPECRSTPCSSKGGNQGIRFSAITGIHDDMIKWQSPECRSTPCSSKGGNQGIRFSAITDILSGTLSGFE